MGDILNYLLKEISEGSIPTASVIAAFVFFYKAWRVFRRDIKTDENDEIKSDLTTALLKENHDQRSEIHLLQFKLNEALEAKLRSDIKILQYENHLVRIRKRCMDCNQDCSIIGFFEDKPEISLRNNNDDRKNPKNP